MESIRCWLVLVVVSQEGISQGNRWEGISRVHVYVPVVVNPKKKGDKDKSHEALTIKMLEDNNSDNQPELYIWKICFSGELRTI